MRARNRVLLAVVVGAVLSLPAAASANDWERSEDRCMGIFGKFDASPLEELKQCTALWEAYRSPNGIREAERHIAIQAFNYLYINGDDEGAFLAESALGRLNERPGGDRDAVRTGQPAVRSADPAAAKVAPATGGRAEEARSAAPARRERYEPRQVSGKETKQARGYNDKGFALAKKRQYDAALAEYEKSIDTDPAFEGAIYNAACMYALTHREKTAVEYLQRLQDLNTEESNTRLHRARVDSDMESLRGDPDFKRLTGYARIKLINSIGEYGEEEIERIEKYLKKAKYIVDDSGVDKHERDSPIIWYKNNVTDYNTAAILESLVNHPWTLLVPIDWDTEFDIIISWGDKITVDAAGNVKVPPVHEVKDPEKSADDALRKQDEALREPDKYSRKVEQTANTPGRAKSKAEGSVKRVEDTMNRAEKATKAIESFGGLKK